MLVDTGVWISFLRNERRPVVERLAQALRTGEEVFICEPVAMELLAGAGTARLSAMERLVNGLPRLEVDEALDFRAAASIYRALRASGHTPRSLSDCLLAAVAIRHGIAVLHDDVDFRRIAAVSGLREVSVDADN